jgi:hypothetical protein
MNSKTVLDSMQRDLVMTTMDCTILQNGRNYIEIKFKVQNQGIMYYVPKQRSHAIKMKPSLKTNSIPNSFLESHTVS